MAISIEQYQAFFKLTAMVRKLQTDYYKYGVSNYKDRMLIQQRKLDAEIKKMHELNKSPQLTIL